MQVQTLEEKIDYPSIIFKLRGGLYCVNSKYVATILRQPPYNKLPNTADYLTGVFPHRNGFIQMVDLRCIFGMPTLEQEYEEFSVMLDARKQDHIHWVSELERSIADGEKFTLATDPHECRLGKWYDHFHCDNNMVMFHLRKIEEPHYNLHKAAVEVNNCSKDCDHCTRNECLQDILKSAKEQYMPKILSLLEEAKEIFQTTVYHEMVLVLEKSQIGIVVDEVLAVEDLKAVGDIPILEMQNQSRYLSGIVSSEKIEGQILELDIEKMMNFIGDKIHLKQ